MADMWQVTFASADSYHSTRGPAIAVFDNRELAESFVNAQPGYGLGIDWFIDPVPFNPPAERIRR